MSIEALEWARKQLVGDAHAKSLLRAVADYAGEEGTCFPSLRRLAHDCEFSEDTVRRKLKTLEDGGWLVRIKSWMDENGRRNTEGRGRETSHEIRLLLGRPPGSAGGQNHEESHDHNDGEGLQPARVADSEASTPATPGVAMVPPPNEPSLKEVNPPNPPSGGDRAVDQDLEGTVAKFAETYPAPITNLPRLRTLLQAMTTDERRKLLTAVKGYASFIGQCERKGKPRAVKDADRWVANGLWQGYVVNGEQVEEHAQRVTVEADSDEGRAWVNLCLVGRAPRPMLIAGGYSLRRALTPQELAFIDLPIEREWAFLLPDQDAQKIGAWREFIGNALQGVNRGDMMKDRGVGADMRRGVLVPWPWPPRKDGSLCGAGPPD